MPDYATESLQRDISPLVPEDKKAIRPAVLLS